MPDTNKTAIPFHRAIGITSHALIDYALVAFLFIGPSVMGFVGIQQTFAYILGIVHLVLTLTSRHPLAPFKIVGMPLHGMIELLVGLLLLTLPWIANFSRGVLSMRFYIAVAVLVLLVWALTDYRGVRKREAGARA